MNWKLCACLVGIWLVIWLCMMKGIKITGKVTRALVNFNVDYNVAMKTKISIQCNALIGIAGEDILVI